MIQEFWVSVWRRHFIIINIITWNVLIYVPEYALLQTVKMEVVIVLKELIIIYQY
jgi:hypothetical protein